MIYYFGFFPREMKIEDAFKLALPHLTTENVVAVLPAGGVVIRLLHPNKAPRPWLRGMALARVNEDGSLHVIKRPVKTKVVPFLRSFRLAKPPEDKDSLISNEPLPQGGNTSSIH